MTRWMILAVGLAGCGGSDASNEPPAAAVYGTLALSCTASSNIACGRSCRVLIDGGTPRDIQGGRIDEFAVLAGEHTIESAITISCSGSSPATAPAVRDAVLVPSGMRILRSL